MRYAAFPIAGVAAARKRIHRRLLCFSEDLRADVRANEKLLE